MTIHLITHRKGGTAAEITAVARRLKEAVIRHGAQDFRLSVEVAGPAAGQWVLAITFRDWTSYGSAMAAGMADPELQAVLTDLDKSAEMTSRRLNASVEL